MTLDEELTNFFKEKIYGLFEDEINAFLDKFEQEDVLQCLLNELNLLVTQNSYGYELAWHLGIIFSDISHISLKYNVDFKAYSWFNNNLVEKGIIFIFLSGYWRNSIVDKNMDTLIALSNTTENAILNKNRKWSHQEIKLAIDAIITGYMNNTETIKNHISNNNRFLKQFQLFKRYLSNVEPNSPDIDAISKYILL